VTHAPFEEMLARRGELAPVEEERLQEHLAGCPQCRATAAAFQQQTRLLRGLQPIEPPAALRAGVLAGIREAPPRRWWAVRPRLPSLPRSSVLLGPAAAALLLVGASALHDLVPAGSAVTSSAPPLPTSVPAATLPAAAGSNSDRHHSSPQSKPTHVVTTHPPRHATGPKEAPAAPVPTSIPVESAPNIALGPPPTAGPPTTAESPVQRQSAPAATSQPPSPQPARATSPHPVPTSVPSKPPVAVAPVRPTVVPVVPTAAPTAVSTITTADPPVILVTAQPYATPSPTVTAQP
jgi:hypothetical protein